MVFNLSGIPLAGLNPCGGSLPYRKGKGVPSSQQNKEIIPNLDKQNKKPPDLLTRCIAWLSELIVKRFVKTKI